MSEIIKFHLIHEFPEQLVLPPLPAKKTVPDWFKKIPGYNENDQTVKKCVPFIDAMTAGYTMLNHIDILLFQTKDGDVRLKYMNDHHKSLMKKHPPIETHPSRQIPGSPMEAYTILKWMNPWVIKTPPEYSTIFLPCINRLESPIIPLVGLVDTDEYSNVVNLPFIHTYLEPNEKEVFIPAGTPMCQVIPIKRETWKVENTWLEKENLDAVIDERKQMQKSREDWYKNNIHVKKRYD